TQRPSTGQTVTDRPLQRSGREHLRFGPTCAHLAGWTHEVVYGADVPPASGPRRARMSSRAGEPIAGGTGSIGTAGFTLAAHGLHGRIKAPSRLGVAVSTGG